MIASAALFFGSLWGRVALGAGIVLALMVVRTMDVSKQQAIGEDRAVAKIEKATDNATQIGTAAAAKSVSGGVRGKRDPTTRND